MRHPNLALTGRTSWFLGWGLILAFWCGVALTDFPTPFADDNYFVGPAIYLVERGVLADPRNEILDLLGRAHHFFVYMPLHAYVLAGWLKLAGISAASFRLFSVLLAALASLLIYRLVPNVRAAWFCAMAVVLSVYGYAGGVGLRPDILGLVFFLLGMTAHRSRTPASFFAANLALGCAVITFPNVALLALFTSLAALYFQATVLVRPRPEIIRLALALAAAYLLCFLLFLWCIDGLLESFLHSFLQAQRFSAHHMGERFQFFTLVGTTKWLILQPACLIVLGLELYRVISRPDQASYRGVLTLTLGCFVLLGGSSLTSATGVNLWGFSCLMVLLFFVAYRPQNGRLFAAWLGFFAVAIYGHGHIPVEGLLAESPPDRETQQSLRAEIASLRTDRLYVDTFALRELYDYRLPAGAHYFEWRNPSFLIPGSKINLLPGSVCAVSVVNAFATSRSPKAGTSVRNLKLAGRRIENVFRNKLQLEIMDNRR